MKMNFLLLFENKEKKLNKKNNLKNKTKALLPPVSGGFSTSSSLLASINSVKDEVPG